VARQPPSSAAAVGTILQLQGSVGACGCCSDQLIAAASTCDWKTLMIFFA
jgi:hypothetical protein